MDVMIEVSQLNKVYDGGFQALQSIDLKIHRGEIFALLGPNGAGKTTLISIICGIVKATTGCVSVGDYDIVKEYKKTRSQIGLVPQELTTDAFESVWNTVSFSRGLFGKAPNPQHIESILKKLSLYDKKDNRILTLSGGMKRRMMIAKALSHEPSILFLDEPTAGVDVELRKDMWDQVHELRKSGVTIILTTHYIEEAEEMADRIGVINQGKLILVEDKNTLMKKMGKKLLKIELQERIHEIPQELSNYKLELSEDGKTIHYPYDINQENKGIVDLLDLIKAQGFKIHDLSTVQSSLEEIFVGLVRQS